MMRGGVNSFSRPPQVSDNTGDVPTAITRLPGLGTLGNTPPEIVNVGLTVPGRPSLIAPQPPNTTVALTIVASNTFRLHA